MPHPRWQKPISLHWDSLEAWKVEIRSETQKLSLFQAFNLNRKKSRSHKIEHLFTVIAKRGQTGAHAFDWLRERPVLGAGRFRIGQLHDRAASKIHSKEIAQPGSFRNKNQVFAIRRDGWVVKVEVIILGWRIGELPDSPTGEWIQVIPPLCCIDSADRHADSA